MLETHICLCLVKSTTHCHTPDQRIVERFCEVDGCLVQHLCVSFYAYNVLSTSLDEDMPSKLRVTHSEED